MDESTKHKVSIESPDENKYGQTKVTTGLDKTVSKGFQNGHGNLFNVSKVDKMNAMKRRMTQKGE